MSLSTLHFRPDDILFCRDGRPMGGAGSGHGARLPEPHVLNSALHAACHRAFADRVEVGHRHRYRQRQDRKLTEQRKERFGALRSAGPFPVDDQGRWYFPTPADLEDASTVVSRLPLTRDRLPGADSLSAGLLPVANRLPAAKRTPPRWLSAAAFQAYLAGEHSTSGFAGDEVFFQAEHTIGIGIDPASGSTISGQFYSRAQLRFREGCTLGAYAAINDRHADSEDALRLLFPEEGRILLGGESRTCSVRRSDLAGPLALPRGHTAPGRLVKWVLLSPAVFPFLPPNNQRSEPHPGGWLPSWVNAGSLEVELLDGPGAAKAKRTGAKPGQRIVAKLVAACLRRPIVITGWTAELSASRSQDHSAGARSTQLAVPAGAVYYFEAADDEHAAKLAAALNWHGAADGTTIVNRRSTLLGEKGFGLGVCGAWDYFGKAKP